MSGRLPSIDLKLAKKLRADLTYRQAFFLAESSALIAKQLIELRRRRGLNQSQVAEALETAQPAISRIERADYRNWSFNTLRRLAEAMDARLRVVIEPSEDVLAEYEQKNEMVKLRVETFRSSDFNQLVRKNAASQPRVIPGKIIEDTESAAAFGRQIQQHPQHSLLDEQGDQKNMPRQSKNYNEMAGAAWN